MHLGRNPTGVSVTLCEYIQYYTYLPTKNMLLPPNPHRRKQPDIIVKYNHRNRE